MEYTTAAWAVRDDLATGGETVAAAAAMYLMQQAWRNLAAADAVWDRLGLELLDVQSRLYAEHEVQVEADPPTDGAPTRSAVLALLEGLAQYHDARAAEDGTLALRLTHDATARQLRHAALLLA